MTPAKSHANGSTAIDESADVCIIGAGWSGLLAARHMTENGLSVVILERREGLGGVWRYSNDPSTVTVMKSTITSSSATVTEASDFPMDPGVGNFVHHRDILDYLERYARHFDLDRHIRFGREVKSATRDAERWRVGTDSGTITSRFLVVSAGLHHRRNDPDPRVTSFTGVSLHTGEIKEIRPDSYGPKDNVLVYGGGESSSDVVEQLAATGAGITWAIPNGQHFFRKAAFPDRDGVACYSQDDSPLDEACSRFIQVVSPFHRSKPGMKWLCLLGSTGSVLDYEGHGIPEWHKGVPFMRAFINKNGHVVELVKTGRVQAEGAIDHVEGDKVTFASGRAQAFTHLISASGYRAEFPFLPPHLADTHAEDRFKLIFDPADPSVAFIGYARPTVGSIPLLSEVQCFYAARVFAGLATLPSPDRMRAAIAQDRDQRSAFFMNRRRPPGLVHIIHYGHDVSKLAGVRPHFGKLFLRSPVAWFKTFFAPAQAAQFRLMDPRTRRAAVDQIWVRQRMRWYVYPWLYLVARLLLVDSLLGGVHRLHRRRQRERRGAPAGPTTHTAGLGEGAAPAAVAGRRDRRFQEIGETA